MYPPTRIGLDAPAFFENCSQLIVKGMTKGPWKSLFQPKPSPKITAFQQHFKSLPIPQAEFLSIQDTLLRMRRHYSPEEWSSPRRRWKHTSMVAKAFRFRQRLLPYLFHLVEPPYIFSKDVHVGIRWQWSNHNSKDGDASNFRILHPEALIFCVQFEADIAIWDWPRALMGRVGSGKRFRLFVLQPPEGIPSTTPQ